MLRIRGESRATNVLILFDLIPFTIYHFYHLSTQFYDSTISSIPHRNSDIKYEYFAQFLINIFETLTRIYDKFKLTFV